MRKIIEVSMVILLTAAPTWAEFSPSQNALGARWESVSSEAWSGSAQTLPDRAILHLAGTSDSSVDTTNGAGVTGFLGLLDPLLGSRPLSPTPTLTPGGPTPTPTSCVPFMSKTDFNLDGNNIIDARDLLMLRAAIRHNNEGNPYDFDCSGDTDNMDLIQFSKYWWVESP